MFHRKTPDAEHDSPVAQRDGDRDALLRQVVQFDIWLLAPWFFERICICSPFRTTARTLAGLHFTTFMSPLTQLTYPRLAHPIGWGHSPSLQLLIAVCQSTSTQIQ